MDKKLDKQIIKFLHQEYCYALFVVSFGSGGHSSKFLKRVRSRKAMSIFLIWTEVSGVYTSLFLSTD